MSIEVECDCGKAFEVKAEFAGKRVRCPACSGPVEVPASAAADVELVEDDSPAKPARKPMKAAAVVEEAPAEKPKKKKKRKPTGEKKGSMAALYMAEARAEQDRDEKRAKAASRGDDESGGFTMFGIHVTAGVAGGFGMLLMGLLSIVVLVFFKEWVEGDPRFMIVAIVCTALGGITLAKILLFGEEED